MERSIHEILHSTWTTVEILSQDEDGNDLIWTYWTDKKNERTENTECIREGSKEL